MAWTNPRGYVTGDLIDDDILNTHLRDNLNALSEHDHGGSAGDGAAALDTLNSITLVNSGEPSTPASTKIIVWIEGATLKVKSSSGTAAEFSLDGHTH